MYKIKYISALLLIIFIAGSCSMVDRIKEKLSSKKDTDKKEQTVGNDSKTENTKEQTLPGTSELDLNFYNKYIEVANKISDVGDNIQKEYISEVPDPKTLRKNSMVLAIAFEFKVNDMERIIKEYRRSLFDSGELSKLTTDNKDMKKAIESDFKDLLDVMEGYYTTAKKVSDYYRSKEFQSDLSLASVYDTEIRSQSEKYRSAFDKFNASVKKYKPAKKKRDISSISNPDEKSIAVLMNTYENTLDNAESLFGNFQKIDRNGDVSSLKTQLDEFESNFAKDKKEVESVPFTEKTKFMKYSFEDYFSKQTDNFAAETRKFLNEAEKSKMKEADFNRGYDNVVSYYNNMINSYNTSIQVINTFQAY